MLRYGAILRLIIISALLCNHAAYASYQNEQINNFRSRIIVNTDASIDITETINVYANQDKIIHGIVRRLPTRYKDSYDIQRKTKYKITRVLQNNIPSKYRIKHENNQIAVYIGDPNTKLTPGNYTYQIQYHVYNAVNFLKDADEIYWNATGNNWDFPIIEAQAYIDLPADAVISYSFAYTGIKGDKGQDYNYSSPEKNRIVFFTTNQLSPGEGMTVAAAWQKGIVTQPSWLQLINQQMNTDQYIVIEVAVFAFIYYYLVWYWYGRNLRRGTIMPLFEPPNNLSPEAMRFIMRMGFDIKAFSAAIVNMAAQGFLTIENHQNEFSLNKVPGTTVNLPEEESQISFALFKGTQTIKLIQSNHKNINEAKDALKECLTQNYQNKYFVTNTKYLLPGIFLSLFAFAAAILGADDINAAFFATLWLCLWSVGCYILLYRAFEQINTVITYTTMRGVISAITQFFPVLIFLMGEVVGIYTLSEVIPIFTMPFLFFIGILNVVFYHLLKAPTPEGRDIMNQIDGFKRYLTTSERYRLNQMIPPSKTPALFEKYLPYAIALDVENEWGAQFEDVLRNASTQRQPYQPAWYRGSSPWTYRSTAALPIFFGAGLSACLSSAAISASSSGSGGGGSSGGGGGGGGGGGW